MDRKVNLNIPKLKKLKLKKAKQSRNVDILIALMMIALGMVTIIFYHHISVYLHLVVGALLIIFATVIFYRYFHLKEFSNPANGDFMVACIMIVISVLVMSVPKRSILAISVIWGLWSVLKGVKELNEDIQFKLQGRKIFWKVALTLFEIVMGTILLMELTSDAIGHHVIVLGISFLSHGLKDLNAVFNKDYDKVETASEMKASFLTVVDKAAHAMDKVTHVMDDNSEEKGGNGPGKAE